MYNCENSFCRIAVKNGSYKTEFYLYSSLYNNYKNNMIQIWQNKPS